MAKCAGNLFIKFYVPKEAKKSSELIESLEFFLAGAIPPDLGAGVTPPKPPDAGAGVTPPKAPDVGAE